MCRNNGLNCFLGGFVLNCTVLRCSLVGMNDICFGGGSLLVTSAVKLTWQSQHDLFS